MKRHIVIAFALLCVLGPRRATSESTAFSPISVGLITPVQFPPEDFGITGVRITGLYSEQRNISGIDLALLGNSTEQRFIGLGIAGGFNLTHGNTTVTGLQLAGLTNINTGKAEIIGIQAALFANVQTAESSIYGVQAAVLGNIGKFTTVNGFELGLYNRALTVNGFQIGLINTATNLHGVQIGLLNFCEKALFAVSPIVNFGF